MTTASNMQNAAATEADSPASDAVAPPPPREARQPRPTESRQKPRKLPPYHVVLLNDDDHTYQYVIEMLQVLFRMPPHQGFRMADKVHRQGRCILMTTTKEHAELKQQQIHAYGADFRIAHCKGSMSSVIEPSA